MTSEHKDNIVVMDQTGAPETPAKSELPKGDDAKADDDSTQLTSDDVDNGDEMFDVVDDKNNVIGQASRRKCHEEGICHRSTHVLLFRQHQPIGRNRPGVYVLLQKRSEHKKVGAGLWDVSVAEHLSPGETYRQATARGLKEELNLNIDADELVQIRQAYLSRQLYEEAGVLDNMFTETFAALYDEQVHGSVEVDGKEVEEVKWWHVPDVVVQAKQKQSDQMFTRWLLIDLRNLDLAEVGNMVTGAM